MSEACPHCNGTGQVPDQDPVAKLRAWCMENGHHISPDDSVYEEAAATILDRKPGTLRNWRTSGGPLPFHRSGRTGRVRYSLEDLAAFLEATRHDK